MKNKDVVNKILAYHPYLENYQGCDEYKCGDPEAECTGVAVALVPTAKVLAKAANMGCSLVIVHEPIFYQTPDFGCWKGAFRNRVVEAKQEMIERNHLTVFRDHDHMHANQPDSIFSGVVRELGWEDYALPSDQFDFNYRFELPKTTVRELGIFLEEKLHLNGLKYIGDPEAEVSRVALVGHLCQDTFYKAHMDENGFYQDYAMDVMRMMEEENIEVIIPGEIIEWTVLSYIRDAVFQGKTKACMNIGHFNLEELGMKDFAEVIRGLVDGEVQVTYIPTEDGFAFL